MGRLLTAAEEWTFAAIYGSAPDAIGERPSGRFLHWWEPRRIVWEGDDGTSRAYDLSEGWAREVSA